MEYNNSLQLASLCIRFSGVSSPYCVSHTPLTLPTTKSGAGPANLQSLPLLHSEGCICLVTSPELSRHKIMCALHVAVNRFQADWCWRRDRCRWTWLCTVELDLQPHNLGLSSAWQHAEDQSKWPQLVETAMLCQGYAT